MLNFGQGKLWHPAVYIKNSWQMNLHPDPNVAKIIGVKEKLVSQPLMFE